MDSSQDKDVGLKCEVKAFYNHSPDPKSRHQKWSEFENPIAEDKRVQELGKAYAVIHRFSKIGNQESDEYGWTTHSIEAQSIRLRNLLDQVFLDYPNWYPDGSPYAVSPPFQPYVHRWEQILETLKQQDTTTKMEFQLLRRELEPRLKQHLDALKRIREVRTINFDLLWLILAPGSLMLSREQGKNCISRLRTIRLVPKSDAYPAYWELQLDQIDWNGSYSGFETREKEIQEYGDSILITKLEVYPIEFNPDVEEIRKQVLARGAKFEALRGFHVATCTGKKYVKKNSWGGEAEKPISGRVIIDAYAYFTCQDSPRKPKLIRAKFLNRPSGPPDIPSEDTDDESDISDNQSSGGEASVERKEDLSPLSDSERMLAVPRVRGFDLAAKEWCEFDVDDIGEVVWDETPYENLVLPPGEKELILAFTDRPRNVKSRFDDFVQHKGEGVIILLCGPPGVGKTLTAEAVADKSKAPLCHTGREPCANNQVIRVRRTELGSKAVTLATY
ncbi:hypothetical protein GGS23DRAFT_546831 [Durotheca rogersii]|uniref:uncharacterized protein n=1 Tax=Durotheca rogersii TaxID=419775 RepID=UPI00221FD0BF|nr:uncharacterized protein GGS23DRAFT_546831 [Durotheca rogersii]KAI5868704.1 hypothetical protein GGS23DRAFT_546831 [Durotheca rogersii]